MIIFDHAKYIDKIKREGISAKDKFAETKIRDVMRDYIANTKYMKGKIIGNVQQIAAGYFYGLPEDLIHKQLVELYDTEKAQLAGKKLNHNRKTITLYESEMRTIAELQDKNLMKMAFAALVAHKWLAKYADNADRCYKYIKPCEGDIYRLADLDNLSGTAKNKLMYALSKRGLISYFLRTNNAWVYCPDTFNARRLFTVNFNVNAKDHIENEKVFMRVTNYDDIMLYLRYWFGDPKVITCADCGCPIEVTSNAKRLCSDCAAKRTAANKKREKLECA